MPAGISSARINNPRTKQILLLFATPKTPKQAAHQLSVRKLKLTSLIKNHLLKCLNPDSRKGRFYVLTDRAREILPECPETDINKDWECIGWVISSPRQRLAIIRCVNESRLNSEEIRMRATQFNSSISRPSIKNILRELIGRHLVDSEILERIRLYWISGYGRKIKDEITVLYPLSPGFSAAQT
jgi:hypothetical protein